MVVEEEAIEVDVELVAVNTVGVTVTVRGGLVTVFGLDDLVNATVSYTISAEAEADAGPPTSTTLYVAAGCGLGRALATMAR